MTNRVGATQWTIGRLMMIVLLIMVLVLVVYGISTKGLNPLIERVGGMFDSIQLMFGFGGGSGSEEECVVYSEYIAGVGEVIVSSCRGSCGVELGEGLSLGKEFNWTGESLFVRKGSDWDEIWDEIEDLPSVIGGREANKILMEEFESHVGGDVSFMSSRIVPIYFWVKGNLGGGKYFKWEDESWFEEKDNQWEKRSWDSFGGLKKIYSESDDLFNDDEVYYRVGISSKELERHLVVGNEDFVSFENIRGVEDSYILLDIFVGDSGQIDSGDDFQIFQDWFFSEGKEIEERQKVLDEGLRNFEGLLSSGESYLLGVVRDSDGEGVFYLENSGGKYGLKGEGLVLVRGDSEAGWVVAESLSMMSVDDEEFEKRVKLHKVRKFLEWKC